ncbi:MAG TPA: aspartate aminotransferase family protein [Elusimicrobia bacterium]|nr:MAG: acetylornithine aminotransferase [Elusimicrobia bacterium RIFOXYA12_FULL_49_49]OGS08723.1 MAG: acetylornithine aminotransferase [Elusimicrobia bacterium RIFOXYA1_FULL_47_7]OGS16220.1 MAG: acetylornithine aminotransferase [Elusimicrobia bacterium RIFOXYA2_FULL_47_53]OGS26580.1 MAG: acetylornithine aminotransferase [Elusimicrobia bacterium RIFOXYB12_FULL_50_12]OGS31375.1 MAG: acetylornithine aminotransferase [Elusimicrobia bacterium RIFOXYB2_FULL_46_23]HBU69520.1 aspartate aminotransfera
MTIKALENKYMLQTYKRFDLQVTRGAGKYLWDTSGKRYLDFFSGISVCNLGHCNPRVVKAITAQASKIIHASNHYYTKPMAEFAAALIESSFDGKVFISNSGAEANECAIKLARKWGSLHGGKYEIIVFNNSFHGRTMATLTATGQPKMHAGFEPLLPGFKYADYNNIESVLKLVNKKTAAIMLEPVLGEGGVVPSDKKFITGLRKLCKKNNLLLIFDEVQTGLGRTGRLYAFEHYGVTPDIMSLGKSIAGGLPLGATVAVPHVASAFSYGDHGSTFGGNPVGCAAAKEVLSQLTPALLKSVTANGKYLVEKLVRLKGEYPELITQVRGLGLMIGMQINQPGRDIVQYCQDKGLIINCTQDTVLRFLPPLIINKQDIKTAVKILEDAIKWKISKQL